MFRQVITLCMLAILCIGCRDAGGGRIAGEDDMLSIYATCYPMADVAAKVGGDKVRVTNMTPPGAEPHDWEPTPADIAALSKADVLIFNGAGLEHWVETVLNSIEAEHLIVVCASDGVELIQDGHDHEEEDDYDPHVWLSVSNAKKEMENVKDALTVRDPDNASYYEANFRRYAGEFDELDQAYRQGIESLANRDLVVSHAAFGYMCRDYGLNQVALEGMTPYSEPDPAKMAEIIKFINDNGVKAVFFEEYGSSKVADMIAKETGASVAALNIIESLSDEQVSAGEDYISVMRRNLETIVRSLG